MPSVGVAAFIFRICANLFFSAMLGFVCWIAARFILISFFDLTTNNDRFVSIIAIGIGTGVGGSVGSLMLGLSPVMLGLRLFSCIVVGVLGALVGLRIGMEVYIPAGMPGIAELGSIVRGAMIAANVLPAVLDIASAIRDRWQRYSRQNAGA